MLVRFLIELQKSLVFGDSHVIEDPDFKISLPFSPLSFYLCNKSADCVYNFHQNPLFRLKYGPTTLWENFKTFAIRDVANLAEISAKLLKKLSGKKIHI
jgi:hypothetical protein